MNLTFVGPHADWIIWWLIIMDIVAFLYILACMNLSKTNCTLVTVRAAVCSFTGYACFFHPPPPVPWMNQHGESLFKSPFDPLAVNARGEIALGWFQGVLLLLLFVFFLRHTPITFPQWLSHVTPPPAVGKGSFLHIFISAYYFLFFGVFSLHAMENNSYPDGTEGVLAWLVSVNDFMFIVSYFSWEII